MSANYSNFKILKEIKDEYGVKILAQVDLTVITNTFWWFTKTITQTIVCVKDSGSECFYDVRDGSYMYGLNDVYKAHRLMLEFNDSK